MPVEIDVTDAPELVGLIYEICVYMFGDYENTPRTGWIEDVDEFCEFIDNITYMALEMSYDEDEEEDIDE